MDRAVARFQAGMSRDRACTGICSTRTLTTALKARGIDGQQNKRSRTVKKACQRYLDGVPMAKAVKDWERLEETHGKTALEQFASDFETFQKERQGMREAVMKELLEEMISKGKLMPSIPSVNVSPKDSAQE